MERMFNINAGFARSLSRKYNYPNTRIKIVEDKIIETAKKGFYCTIIGNENKEIRDYFEEKGFLLRPRKDGYWDISWREKEDPNPFLL